jgi:hypothetical protein
LSWPPVKLAIGKLPSPVIWCVCLIIDSDNSIIFLLSVFISKD